MSITFPTIITADDYRAFQTGNNSPINDNDIQSAINTTFIQLNGICNNQIMLRWDLTSGDDMLNQTQKDLIIQAFLLQTKYNLDYDNDTSEGSVQSSFGANTYSSTRPRRDKITQDVLNLLNKAGVYSQVTVSSVTRSPLSRVGSWSSQYYAPLDSYITYEYGDAKYVWKNWGTEYAGRYLYIDASGRVATTTAGGSAVWGGITGTLDNQTDLMNKFALYYTASECDDKFFLESEGVALDLRLEAVEDDLPNKVTKSTIDNKQLLYARENGTEKTIVYGATTDLGSGTIPTRVAGGNLRVPDSPTNDNDAICKKVNNLDNYYTKTESDNKYQTKITSSNKLDYSLLSNTPTIPTKTSDLTNDSGYITKSVDNLDNYYKKSETYTQTEVDNLIASETAHFLGNFTGGATRPASFDYDTFIKSQIPSGTTVTNNDYVLITWTDSGEYDRCKYDSSTTTWSYEFTIIGDITGLTTRVTTIEGLIPSTATTTNRLVTLSEVPAVTANPTLAGTESELSGLQVGTTKYKVDRVSVSSTGTSTTTLPEYMTVNGTEYLVLGQSHLYQHSLQIVYTDSNSDEYHIYVTIFNDSSTAVTTSTLDTALTNYFFDTTTARPIQGFYSGYIKTGSNEYIICNQNIETQTFKFSTQKVYGTTYTGTVGSYYLLVFDASFLSTPDEQILDASITSVVDGVVKIR